MNASISGSQFRHNIRVIDVEHPLTLEHYELRQIFEQAMNDKRTTSNLNWRESWNSRLTSGVVCHTPPYRAIERLWKRKKGGLVFARTHSVSFPNVIKSRSRMSHEKQRPSFYNVLPMDGEFIAHLLQQKQTAMKIHKKETLLVQRTSSSLCFLCNKDFILV